MPEPAFPWLESKTPRRTADDLLAELDEIAPQKPAQQPATKPSSGGVVRLAQVGIPFTKNKVVIESKDLGDGAFADSVERGTAQLIGSVDYAASLIGRLAERARIPGATEYADRKLNEATELFGYAEKRPGRVSLEELAKSPTFAKAGTFLAEVAGEQLPNLLLTFGAGGIAAAAAKKAAVAGATKQILQRTGQQALTSTQARAVAKVAGQKAAKAGGTAALATVAPLEAGEAGYSIRQETGEDSPLIAIGAGVVNAYLEKLVPQKILKDIFTADSPTKKLLWREVVGNTASTVARNLGQEGLTEIAQESVQVAATKLADSSYDAVNRDNFWRLLEAGVKGAIVGGSISVPTSGYSQTRRKLTADQLNSEIGKAAATIDKEMRRQRDEEIKQQAKATREKDTTTPAGTKPATPPGSATTVGATAEQATPRQADQGAPQGVVAAGNERVVGGKTYTKKGDFWYYTDKKGREKIVEGGTPKQEKLLEELEAPTTESGAIGSTSVGAPQISGRETQTAPPLVASPPASATPPEATPQALPSATSTTGGDTLETPIPDTPQQIAAQLAATADPSNPKAATLILSGGATPQIPSGLVAVQIGRGTVVVNPAKADPQSTAQAIQRGEGGVALGYSQERKPSSPRVAVVQGRNQQGVPVTEELADEAGLPGAIAAASQQGTPAVVSTAQAVDGRVRDSIAPAQETTVETLPQANTLFVAQAVRQAFGFTPERVQIVYEPSAPWNARVVGDVIQLNSARLDAREVGFKLAHELAHILYRTPVFRDAFAALLNSLSTEERQRVMDAIALYKDQPQSIQDEEAQVRALEEILRVMQQPQNRTAWQRFTDLVAEAFYSFFGVQTTNREELAARVVAISGVNFLRGQAETGSTRESLSTTPGQVLVASNATVVHPDVRESLVAHHGTPHKVDRFTTAKIGTGEGAQVYGWGLYFAENEAVAEEYRRSLATEIVVDGKVILRNNKRVESTGLPDVDDLLIAHDGNVAAALAEADEMNREGSRRAWQAAVDYLRKAKVAAETRGRTYTVRLNVEPEQLLDWDKPLSEQSEQVKKALVALQKKYGDASRATQYLKRPNDYQGSALYDAAKHDAELFELKLPDNWRELPTSELKKLSDAAPIASQMLSSLGIRGIRYLDQGSRAFVTYPQAVRAVKPGGPFEVFRTDTGQRTSGPFNSQADAQSRLEAELGRQTYNYVIFDENDIEITHENGQPVSFAEATGEVRYDLTTRAPQVTRQRDLQSTPEQQQEYLSSAFTQNAALYRPLSRIAEVMGAPPKVKAMLGLQQIEKLFSVIPWWSKRMTYDEMMREVTDEGARKNAQWDVFQRLMLFQDQHESRKRKLRDIIAKINHSRFIALISKEQIAKERLEAKSNLVQQFRTVMAGAVAGAMSRLERTAASREEQLLRAEIKSLENQRDLSEGVGETAIQIVNAIANDMDIYETLIVENPSPEKILSWWRQVNPEAPTSTPTAKLAAYILSRNNRIVLKLAVVQQLLENQEVRDEVSRTEKVITNALGRAGSDAERMEIMQKYFEKAKNKQDAEFRAYRRWFDLNQSIQREVERFDSLTEAIRIGEAVINDDEFKRVRMETQKAVNAVVTPPWWSDKKRKEFAENSLRTKTDFSTLAQMGYVHVVLPDGTQHIHHLAADKKDLEKAVEALAKDADIITDWLSENPDSPYAPFYQIQLDQIRGTYLTSLVGENNKNLAIAHGIPLLSSSLGMLRWALKDIGTPSAKIAAKLAAIWDIHSEFMETWMPTWYPGAVRALYDAAESHDFIKKAKAEGDRNWFIVWKREIGNELMARLQNKGSGIDVGSTLSSGYQVTKADMAYVRYLQRAFSAAYAKIEQPMQSVKGLPEIQDFIANRIPVVRERLDRGDIVLPRRLDRELGPLVGDVMKLLRTGPYAGRIEVAEEILSSDKLWPQVESYLHDMHPDFAKRTRLTDALKLAGERLMEKRAAERNGTRYEKDYPEESMQGLYEFVADHIDTTESEGELSREDLTEVVRREFLGSIQSADGTTRPLESLREDELRFVPGEFGNILERFESAATTPDDYTKSSEVTILDQHNSFNASRGRRIAPYGFYTHGVTTEGDWLSFRSNGASFQMEMMVASLRAVIGDLESKLLSLKRQFGSGNQLPSKAIRQGRAQLQSGETMYEWDKLQDQIDRITKFIASLESAYGKGGRANTHELRKLSRAVGLLVRGLLTSGLVAIGNVISPQAAAVRSSITGAATMSFARAYGNLARVLFQMGIGAMKSVPPAARRALSSVASMKIPDAVGVWEELFEGAMARGGANAELKRLGLDKPLRMRQKLENMVILPRTGGRLTESANRDGITGAVSDTIGVLTTLAEAAIVFAEPLQPEYGDRLVNAAAYRDGVGLTEWVEDRLRRVYGRYRESGRDPKTAPLNASDIYGNWLLRRPTQSNLNNLTEWFNLAGVPFRETAHRFFDALDAAPNKDDVSLLTPTEQDVMATVLVPEINKATRSTRPIATSTDFWAQMFLLLKGWSFFDITRKRHRFGTAATAKGSEVLVNRVQQLMLIAVVTAMMGAVGWDLVEILKRYWAKYLRGEERASRAWWEQEGLDKLKGLAKSWGTQWPIVGDMIVGFTDDLPGSARQGSLLSPVILSKLTDIGRYVAGAVNTQDPRFGASQLLKGLMPEPASVVLNRMPTESGSVAMVNARRLLSRFGDKEWLVKPMGFGMSGAANYTPIHPVIERAVNAIGNGDFEKFQRYYDEAVQMAEEGGKDYRTVLSMLKSRHPVKRAYGKAVPADIMEKFLSRMGDQRASVEEAINRFDTAVAMVSPVKTRALPAPVVASYGTSRPSSRKVDLTPAYMRGTSTTRSSSTTRRRTPTLPSRFRTPTLAQSIARRSNARRRPTIRI